MLIYFIWHPKLIILMFYSVCVLGRVPPPLCLFLNEKLYKPVMYFPLLLPLYYAEQNILRYLLIHFNITKTTPCLSRSSIAEIHHLKFIILQHHHIYKHGLQFLSCCG